MADDLSGFSMLELFRLEAEIQTAVLSSGILAVEELERSPATIESMMRAAHSLKGAARIIGLEPAVRVAHALEDCFVAAGKQRFTVRPEHGDVLLQAVDFLSTLANAPDALEPTGPWPERAEAIVTAIDSLAAESSSPSPSPLPEPRQSHSVAIPAPQAEESVAAPSAMDTSPDPRPDPVPHFAEPPRRDDSVDRPTADLLPSPWTAEQDDRVVRVSSESLTRLVGLAGESLVETRQLRPFVENLQDLRTAQIDLCDNVTALEELARTAPEPLPIGLLPMIEKVRRQAERALTHLVNQAELFEGFARRNEDLSGRLHHEVIISRMRPLADGIKTFPRMVRDLARTLDKTVRFESFGEQTGVDRDILAKLEAPLSHLIRNALDHGIETPSERQEAGKPAAGMIHLEARHRAGMLHISITDDGRGIDIELLRKTAVHRELVAAHMADQLSEAELLEFIFLPGFSTRSSVTEISGRGVGLDAVRSMVKSVGGSVRATTVLGQQTTFSLQLPITMSVIRALLVHIGGEPYAFPLTRIDHILFIPHSAVRAVEGRQYFDHDETSVGLVLASQILEVTSGPPPSDPMPIVVISDRGQRFGMIVDAFLGERDLEVRPLHPQLSKVPDINSASLLENGDPVLIVDVEDLVLSIDNVLMGRRLKSVDFANHTPQIRHRKRILVVDDSITVRELERQLLQAKGFLVDVAVDGMDGWNAIRGGVYDLVVSDVDMPRMDGIGLVSLVKNDPLRKDTPVVIVSYKDREEDRIRGLEAGANRYLTKSSFHDETFVNTVIDLIGEST